MEKYATDKTKYLDVCCVQSCISSSLRKDTFYYMTLLSHAAVHGRKVMVEELISNGASKDLYLHAYGPLGRRGAGVGAAIILLTQLSCTQIQTLVMVSQAFH